MPSNKCLSGTFDIICKQRGKGEEEYGCVTCLKNPKVQFGAVYKYEIKFAIKLSFDLRLVRALCTRYP